MISDWGTSNFYCGTHPLHRKVPTCDRIDLFFILSLWQIHVFLFLQIIMESKYMGGQLAELFENSESADVALHCAGQIIKAHSVILAMRSIPMKMLG